MEPATHFRLPSYKVSGATFIVIQGDEHVIFSVSKDDVAAFDGSDHIQEIRRSPNIFVGVRASLDDLTQDELEQLTKMAWKNKAPKKLAKSLEE